MRSILLDPMSATVKYVRRALAEYNVHVSTEAAIPWFRTQRATTITPLLLDSVRQKLQVTHTSPVNVPLAKDEPERDSAASALIRFPELFANNFLRIGDRLTLKTPRGDVQAQLVDDSGHVCCGGNRMSAGAWGREIKGWSAINIYDQAAAEMSGRAVSLQELPIQALSRSRSTDARQDAEPLHARQALIVRPPLFLMRMTTTGAYTPRYASSRRALQAVRPILAAIHALVAMFCRRKPAPCRNFWPLSLLLLQGALATPLIPSLGWR